MEPASDFGTLEDMAPAQDKLDLQPSDQPAARARPAVPDFSEISLLAMYKEDVQTRNRERDVPSRVSDLEAFRESLQTQLRVQGKELEKLKTAQVGNAAQAISKHNHIQASETRMRDLIAIGQRSSNLLYASWAYINELQQQTNSAQQERDLLQIDVGYTKQMLKKTQEEMMHKNEKLNIDNEIMQHLPDLLGYVTKKRKGNRKTVKISNERMARLKELMDGREGKYVNTTPCTDRPACFMVKGEAYNDITGTTTTTDTTDNTATTQQPHPQNAICEAPPSSPPQAAQPKTTDLPASEPVSSLSTPPKIEGAAFFPLDDPTPQSRAYKISFSTFDASPISDPAFNVNRYYPDHRWTLATTTTITPSLAAVRAMVTAHDASIANTPTTNTAGCMNLEFAYKLEDLNLSTLVAYNLVLQGKEEQAVNDWIDRVAREDAFGRGEDVRVLKIFAYPRETVLEVMTALLMG